MYVLIDTTESEPPAPINRNIFHWRIFPFRQFIKYVCTYLTHSPIVKNISRIPNLKAREPSTLLHIHITGTPLGMGPLGRAAEQAWKGERWVRECGNVSFVNISYTVYRGEGQGLARVAERGPHSHSLDSLHTINDSLKKKYQYPSGDIFFKISIFF